MLVIVLWARHLTSLQGLLMVGSAILVLPIGAGLFPTRGGDLLCAAIAAAVFAGGMTNSAIETWLAQGPFSPTAVTCVWSAFVLWLCSDRVIAGARSLDFNAWRRLLAWTVAGGFGLYMIVLPAISIAFAPEPMSSSRALEDPTMGELIRLHITESFFAVFFFTLGATIGSFLNVVAYRMPRGESVVLRSSRCPRCTTAIQPRDNIPVLGWLLLNGRCRACQVPISAQYPIVEFIAGAVFLALYLAELISGGRNLPVRDPNFYAGVVWILMYTKWDLVGLYAYHCFQFATLGAWTLIEFDRQAIPLRSIATALIFAVVPPLLLPFLQPMPAILGQSDATARTLVDALVTTGAGVVAGLLAGWLLSAVVQDPSRRSRGVMAAMSLAGVMLGWQAVLVIVLGTLILESSLDWLVSERVRTRWPLIGSLFVSAFVHQLTWRWSADLLWLWREGARSTPRSAVTAGVIVAAIAFGVFYRRRQIAHPAAEAMYAHNTRNEVVETTFNESVGAECPTPHESSVSER
ncbi:Leader peptidase PppA [Caulifigura coniformis]|uniref:Leader peptidase PppA n=1 Tax=Caulifigura coniformis TaxID=2527983 RepID=A0A517SKB8_9PLAN|nr:Leader peptidase PppA [Caulifigura coniformis]